MLSKHCNELGGRNNDSDLPPERMQFKCVFEKDPFRKELDKSVTDSLGDNFTDCCCKQIHNLFPTLDNSDDQEFFWFQSMAQTHFLAE